MAQIVGIKDPCTVRIKSEWKFGKLKGYLIRIAGLHPPDDQEVFPSTIREMDRRLRGRNLKLLASHFVQSGRVLVAQVEIEGISLKEFFAGRFAEDPPKPRSLVPGDTRNIIRVKGYVPVNWHNPLALPTSPKPSLGNFDFPTDPWLPDYNGSLRKVASIFSHERENRIEDELGIQRFLTQKNEKVLLVFGSCGCGKSWFIREYFASHPPKEMDVAFIDVSDYPEGEGFTSRLNLRLSELLGECVNNRNGGLRIALNNICSAM